MRITSDLLLQAEQRTNPENARELVLREWGISVIENMGAVVAGSSSGGGGRQELFDAIDLSNNRIARLENFPRLRRLTDLLCPGNVIESFDAPNLSKNLPNLRRLTLSYNAVSSLAELSNLASACPRLEFLSLVGNPVTRRQHYRLYLIHKLPSLKVLDYSRVKPSERVRAERLAASAAGAALEGDVRVEAAAAAAAAHQQQGGAAAKTFEPGEGADGGGRSFAVVASFTDEEKEQIRRLLSNATSAGEVEEIESSVRRGVLPAALLAAKKKEGDGDGGGKRKREENDNGGNGGDGAAPQTSNGARADDGDGDQTPAAKRRQAS